MFENRTKGAQLVKRISYFYLLVAVLVIVATAIFGISGFSLNIIFYIIMSAVLYLLSTRFQENKNTWIFVVICAIITIIWTLSLIGLVLTILLIVAANDMRKELE
ncbi:hypothetical protein [Methanobrevibacter sp.]|uniref:hypothetical protein n=1 Tax=Methanobrevibacter sp. TaxID=66852 RepID=UPI00388DFB45